jgi:hypothetical protein
MAQYFSIAENPPANESLHRHAMREAADASNTLSLF